MTRSPYDLPVEGDRRVPEWVKALSALLAIITWALFFFTLSIGRSYGAAAIEGMRYLSYMGAAGSTIVGSLVSLFAVSKKDKHDDLRLRVVAIANYCGLLVLVGIPLFRSLVSHGP